MPATLNKITAIHNKSGPFDCCLLLGDVCSSLEQDESLDQVLDGSLTVPLPCYFTMGATALPRKVIERIESNEGELVPNLVFLGEYTSISCARNPPSWPAITKRNANVLDVWIIVPASSSAGSRPCW